MFPLNIHTICYFHYKHVKRFTACPLITADFWPWLQCIAAVAKEPLERVAAAAVALQVLHSVAAAVLQLLQCVAAVATQLLQHVVAATFH